MHYTEVESAGEYLVRLETGRDWRGQLEAFADTIDATAGWFTGMGAVRDAEVWYYDQDVGEYQPFSVETPVEVAACIGNVSLLDDERFAHTHAVLADESRTTVAGHLNRAETFAGEVYFRAFATDLVREYHEPTDLDLWL